MHDALARDVVWQTAKRLQADDIGHTLINEFYHLTGQEPALTGHIAEADMTRGQLRRLIDCIRRPEMTALFKRFAHRLAEELDDLDEQLAEELIFVLTRKQLMLSN